MAAAIGAIVMLGCAGFRSDILAFTLAAAAAPLLGWAAIGLLHIHGDARTRTMSIGFWITEVGVFLLAAGYLVAALGAAGGNESLIDNASQAAIAPGFLVFLPIGLGLFGLAAWQIGTLGAWKRLLPSLTAAGGVLAPQLMLLGFAALGFVMATHNRDPGPSAG